MSKSPTRLDGKGSGDEARWEMGSAKEISRAVKGLRVRGTLDAEFLNSPDCSKAVQWWWSRLLVGTD